MGGCFAPKHEPIITIKELWDNVLGNNFLEYLQNLKVNSILFQSTFRKMFSLLLDND